MASMSLASPDDARTGQLSNLVTLSPEQKYPKKQETNVDKHKHRIDGLLCHRIMPEQNSIIFMHMQ